MTTFGMQHSFVSLGQIVLNNWRYGAEENFRPTDRQAESYMFPNLVCVGKINILQHCIRIKFIYCMDIISALHNSNL